MARTLAITQNVTLDGSIETLGDWFSPQGQADVPNAIDATILVRFAGDQGWRRGIFPLPTGIACETQQRPGRSRGA